jgi:ATP-dependent RNA helicase DHR2
MALPAKRKRNDASPPNQTVNKRQKLLETRKNLPVWSRQKDIRSAIRDHDVLVLSGETGSGKSTQVPQFILDLALPGQIAVTQPRRVAAISLAKRVAEEMGTPCGSSSPASKVGYSVRFDQSTSPSTRIKYLTEGMLLQEMLRDGDLKEYSCVIVDEVHERSVNVDLILGFLKQLVRKRRNTKKPLKVIVMSATVDVESISRFFSQSPSQIETNGKTSNGDDVDGSESSWEGVSDGDPPATPPQSELQVSLCHVEGRQYPVKLHYLPKPTEDVLDTTLQQIFKIHCREPMPGDMLVFMTGQETIQNLQKLVEE